MSTTTLSNFHIYTHTKERDKRRGVGIGSLVTDLKFLSILNIYIYIYFIILLSDNLKMIFIIKCVKYFYFIFIIHFFMWIMTYILFFFIFLERRIACSRYNFFQLPANYTEKVNHTKQALYDRLDSADIEKKLISNHSYE